MRYLVRELGNAWLNTNTCFFLRVPALSCALSILGSIFRACLTTDLFPKSSPAQKCSGELTVPSRYFFLFFSFLVSTQFHLSRSLLLRTPSLFPVVYLLSFTLGAKMKHLMSAVYLRYSRGLGFRFVLNCFSTCQEAARSTYHVISLEIGTCAGSELTGTVVSEGRCLPSLCFQRFRQLSLCFKHK